jgi:lambda family portal protein
MTKSIKCQSGSDFMDRARARELAAGYEPKILTASTDASTALGYAGGYGYDATRDSPARSAICFPLNPKREFNSRDRKVVLEKIRSLEANLGLIPRMKGQVGKYSVGRGIFPIPTTKDEDWNEAAAELFDDWANNRSVCDAAAGRTFWKIQRYCAETFFSEAEAFAVMVSSSVAGAPQLQLFDASEIGGGWGIPQRPGFLDGIRANAQHRALEYEVVTADAMGKPTTQIVSALDMIHVFEPKRPGQLRPISPFAPAVNPAIDVMDLDSVITQSAKLHNALGIKVTKKSCDAGKTGVAGRVRKLTGEDGKVTEVREDFIRGALIQYLGLDEDIDIVSSDRPTENILNFLVYRIRNICLTTGLPFEVVWDLSSLGGVTARLAVKDAQWFFDGIQDTINELLNQRVWVWRIASAMKNGELRMCTDPKWWRIFWLGPPKLDGDAGRTMQGEIDALYSGFNNWESYFARVEGRFWKDPIKQRIREIAWAMDECEKARDGKGVPFEYICALKPGTVSVDLETGALVASGGSAASKSAKTEPPVDANADFKTRVDAYGVAVRAGAITPSQTDEETFRSEAGLPPMSKEVKAAWSEDGGVRRPITLVQAGDTAPAGPGIRQQPEGEE